MTFGPSATGRYWVLPSESVLLRAEQISQHHSVPDLLARVLAMRDVDVEDVPGYLDPKLKDLMPDPYVLTDMEKAARRLAAAVDNDERVGLFGDYDVDGACSLALLVDWLREFQIEATYSVPNRQKDGYGPNAKAMAELAADHDLVIVVDCGGAEEAEPALAAAVEGGADVIVVDHHASSATPQSPLAVINPNRPDDVSGLGHLCAAGVVFMLLVAVNRLLRERGRFEGNEEPLLKARLDLVGLATVADVAKLHGLNRAFVRRGLEVMAKRQRPGLAALSDAARVRRKIDESTLGWMLGPRLNAPGRIGENDLLATRLLLADNEIEAVELAEKCDDYNNRRRKLLDDALIEARSQVASRDDGLLAWAVGENWHPGVMGIVAGRIADQKRTPSITLSYVGEVARGSGRSAPGIDLGSAVRQAFSEGLLLRGGGHSGAVGLEVDRKVLPQAMERIEELLRESLRDGKLPECKEQVAATVLPGAMSADIAKALSQAGPHGMGAPKPKFVLNDVRLSQKQMLKDQHYRLEVCDIAGSTAKAMAFGVVGTPLGEALETAQRGDPVDLMGAITVDDFDGGRRSYLRVDDVILH